MPIDSTADLLFRIGANTDDGEANIERFRALLSKDLGDLGAEFSAWSTRVFGDLTTVQGAMIATTAALGAGLVALGAAAVECAGKYREYVEEVERGSRATGISTEAMSGLHLMAEEAGVSYDTLVRGLTRFASSIVKASEGGGEQMKMFHALGISQEQVKAGQKDMLPLLELVMDRFHQMGPSVASSAAARAEFGRGIGEMLRLLGMGGAQLQHYIEKAKEMGIQVHATDVEAVEQFNATMRVTKSELGALALEFGQHMLPVLENFMIGVIAAGVALKNLPQAIKGVGAFATAFAIDIQKIGEQVRALAQNMAAFDNKPMFDPPALKEVKEHFQGISDVLTEIMSKEADLAGPEAKAADEGQRLRDRLDEARQKLKELHAEGKVSAEDFANQMQDMRIAEVMLPELIAKMLKEVRQKTLESVRAAGQEIQQELLRQGPQTLAVKVAEWEAEIKAKRDKLFEAKHATEENLAELDELYHTGLDKIWNDAGAAEIKLNEELQAKLLSLGEKTHATRVAQLDRDVQTEREKIEKVRKLNDDDVAYLGELRRIGMAKIAAEEKAAGDAELARLGEQLERIESRHQTSAQKIEAQYQADVKKFSAAEERKSLVLAANIYERAAIMAKFEAIKKALRDEEEKDLNDLKNSEGWQGVFGGHFAQLIKGDEGLLEEWKGSHKKAQLMMKVVWQSLKQDFQDTFNTFAQGMAQSIAQAIVYQKSIGEAMKEATKAALAELSARALGEAIYSTALGFLCLAEGDVAGAAAAFEAAAIFGAVGVGAGMLGRAIKTSTGGSSPSSSTAAVGGVGLPGSGSVAGSDNYGTGGGGAGQHVTVNLYGHVFGTSGMAEVVNMISDAVLNQGATLTATNTVTGRQVQR